MEDNAIKPKLSTLQNSNKDRVIQDTKSEQVNQNFIEYQLPIIKSEPMDEYDITNNKQVNKVIKSEPIENMFIKQEVFDDPIDTSSIKTELPDNNINEFNKLTN